MNIIEMPLGTPSLLLRGTMPGWATGGTKIERCDKAIAALKVKQIANIVLLCSDKDCYAHTGLNLREKYEREGFNIFYFPIPDHDVPAKENLRILVDNIVEKLRQEGQNTIVHCWAGNGRTGMVLACIARRVLNIKGDEAILWVRDRVPGAIKEESQQEMVRVFLEDAPGPQSRFTSELKLKPTVETPQNPVVVRNETENTQEKLNKRCCFSF
jgi:protein-tyrosine phosphatase